MTRHTNRRRFLRGVGAAVALPAFESLPRSTSAADRTVQAGRAVTETGAPLRLGFVYIPSNGVNLKEWAPTGTGPDFQLGSTMTPLAELKDEFQVISQLKLDTAVGHVTSPAAFLTGATPRKTTGADIHLGISADQLAARHVNELTRLSSLELTTGATQVTGTCNQGYSCAYRRNISWRSVSNPMTPESNPRLVFERLFGSGSKTERVGNLKKRQREERSLLDFVMEDARSLKQQLGRNDQQKLDEYLYGVRAVEKQIEKAERFPIRDPGVDAPEAFPASKQVYIRLMFDMMFLAYQTDTTRVVTFNAEGSTDRSFPEIGIPKGHHGISHHQNRPEKLALLAKIDRWYLEQLRYFLNRMQETKDVDGNSLLHNSMIVYGTGISNGHRHSHDKLPVILAGRAGGRLRSGQHVDPGSDTPMSNLLLSMLDMMGVPDLERFGDSTGRLHGIS